MSDLSDENKLQNEEQPLSEEIEKTGNASKDDSLEKELSELTRLFREELKKAEEQKKAEEEAGEEFELIQQLDDIPEGDGEEKIPEEELCACCGERARDRSISPNYEYCAECRENMRKYPIGIHHTVTAVAVIICAVISVMTFGVDLEGYNYARLAKKSERKGELTSAVSYYDDAIECFEDNSVACKILKLKSAECIYATLPSGAKSISETASRIEENLSAFEAKLPFYKKYVNIRNSALSQYAALEQFYSVMGNEEYSGFDGTDGEIYSKMQAELEGLVGTTTEITAIGDSKEKTEVVYDEGMLRFAQYMLAYSCKNDEDAYRYITLMKEASPEAVCLYGYELSLGEIKKGNLDAAAQLTDAMLENNAEDANAYIIKSALKRLSGDADGALDVSEEGLKIDETNADLYRQKAMALILKGDFDGALESAEAGIGYSQYGALYYVYFVAATEKGDAAAISSAKEQIDALGIGYTDRMTAYVNGTLSAKQLFSEGTGDVE